MLRTTSRTLQDQLMTSAYEPLQPARRPETSPGQAPTYRVLVHRKYTQHYSELPDRVGVQQAQQLWDHLASNPGRPSPIASTTVLKGEAGRPKGPGWSRTIHYEVSSSARVDYQYCDEYRTSPTGDPHKVVAILTISFGSH
jgi:hypothetical protein